MSENEMKLTYSTLLDIDGKKTVSVRFERDNDVAEGTLPEGRIMKNSGFSADEVTGIEYYLKDNSDDLMAAAKKISGLKHILS